FTPEIFERVRTLSAHERCVAIGELGLDFYYETSGRQVQFQAFEAQLDHSVACGKPVVVHTRDADADTLRFLDHHSRAFARAHPGRAPGVIHCFTGGKELARQALGLGYYISFSGIITFKNAEELREVVRDVVPIE